MINYFTDPDAMNLPWCESPFFYKLRDSMLSSGSITEQQAEQATFFHEQGYLVLDLELDPTWLDELVAELDEQIMKGAIKTQDGRYHYGNGPRVFEAWKTNAKVLELARHQKAMDMLEFLYRKPARPFQTINFKHGSNQPLHSDAMHFHTQPERYVCGFWTALEDIDITQGPLVFYPGSHKLPITEFQELKLKHTAYNEHFDQYAQYEEFVKQLAATLGDPQYFTAKKGQALIWASNLLHGGSQPWVAELTRWSQATHVYFEGCNHYYCPFFSDRWEGHYAEKDLSGKNIREYRVAT